MVFEKKTNWETKTDEAELHIFHIVKNKWHETEKLS